MISKFIEKLRVEGMTQYEIANKTGFGQSYISQLSKGKNCSLETVIKFADIFHVSTDEVLGRTGVRKNENGHYKGEERRKKANPKSNTAINHAENKTGKSKTF